MNKLVLKMVSVTLLSSVMFAGVKYEITPMVGKKLYNYSDDSPRFDDGEPVLGARANVYFNDTMSVQFGVEGSKDNGIEKPGRIGAKTDLLRGMVSVQKDIPTKSKLTPYVFVGLGGEKVYKPEETTNVDSQMFYNGGAGVRYSINDKVDLVGEVRAIHKIEDSDNDIIGNVGVGFKFGQNQKVKTLQDIAALTPKKAVVVNHVEPVAPAVIEEVVEPIIIDGSIDEKEIAVSKEILDEVSPCIEPEDITSTCPSDREDGSSIVEHGYYVQVISLAKNSTDVITRRLNAKGFGYVFEENGANTRVLVGPYSSRNAAIRDLRRLKEIKKDSFIVSR